MYIDQATLRPYLFITTRIAYHMTHLSGMRLRLIAVGWYLMYRKRRSFLRVSASGSTGKNMCSMIGLSLMNRQLFRKS